MKKTKRLILSCAALLAFCLAASAWEDGALPGAFTINEKGDKIQFSQGNLWFNAMQGDHTRADGTTAKGMWWFAEHQWDFVGEDNQRIDERYDECIDLFGWGTSGNDALPYDTDKTITDLTIAGTNHDWGVYNPIGNGGNQPGIWRTPTIQEWVYLVSSRPNAEELCGPATVVGVPGFVYLPDDWVAPEGIEINLSFGLFGDPVSDFNEEEWENMEKAGAVFLPAAGFRNKSKNIEEIGELDWLYYWTSTGYSSSMAADYYGADKDKTYGYCVRLVRNVSGSDPGPGPGPGPGPKPEGKILPGQFSVAEGKQVIFSQGNLKYKASTNTWRFAENQYDAQGDKNSNIAEDYTDFIDVFGWGTSGFYGKNPWMTSTTPTDYGDGTNDIAGTNFDWGVFRSKSITNNAGLKWRTLTADEWYYLFYTRPNRGAGRATACNMHGYILLPDGWQQPEGLEFTKNAQTWDVNVYDADDWAKMEQAGAVFLPAAGYRYGATEYKGLGEWGYYWTSSAKNDNNAVSFYFAEYAFDASWSMGRENGYSVRLVSDVLRKKGDVNGDGKVNTADVVAVYTYIEKGDASGFTRDACNVNGDSSVNTADVVAIYTLIIGGEASGSPAFQHQIFRLLNQ